MAKRKITKTMVKRFVEYKVAPNHYENLNQKGRNFYKKKLTIAIKKGNKIKI